MARSFMKPCCWGGSWQRATAARHTVAPATALMHTATVSFRLPLSSQPSAPSRGSLLQLWNASQLEMVFYGKMHGFMRSVRWWIVSFSCMNDFPTFDALLVLKNTGISVI